MTRRLVFFFHTNNLQTYCRTIIVRVIMRIRRRTRRRKKKQGERVLIFL